MNLAVLGVNGGITGVVGSSGARIQGGRNWASQLSCLKIRIIQEEKDELLTFYHSRSILLQNQNQYDAV